MTKHAQLVVLGGGPGGYPAAFAAADHGMNVVLVDEGKQPGGVCLNRGCIPSKALLHASEMFHEAEHGLEKLGVKTGKPKLDLKAMMAHKEATIKSNVDGVSFLMKKNKVDVHHGTGSIPAKGKVAVTDDKGKETVLETKNIVIATGSDVAGIPGVDLEFDEKVIVSSTGALALSDVPRHMVVVGGGVIGLELGSVWSRLGAKVTVIEFLDKILGAMDGDLSKNCQRVLAKQGLDFKLSSKVTEVKKSGKGAKVTFEP
ncbi:MAG: FAD-dependent oxidoreductase, partial [Planctomycetaceae bacterium]|nr:FAD-dependent oxidoreductase [Planctomycetaceae bacterium]